MALTAKIKARRLEGGDEAHRVEFSDGSRAYYHFNGGEIKFQQAGQEIETVEWDIDTWDARESAHWNEIQEEYSRIDQAQGDYLEMSDSEYNEWKEAMNS